MTSHPSDYTANAGPGEGRRLESRVAAALIVVGVALRVWVWLGQRSLWIDEATVALGVLTHPFGPGFGGHDFGQISPPLWLAAVRASAVALGPSELALRLPTLLLAIGYLPAVWWLGRRFLGPSVGIVALAWSAVSPALVAYAAELKPYGADPLATTVVLGASLYVGRADRLSLAQAVIVGVLLSVSCWISNPAAIVMLGVLPVVWFGGLRIHRPADWPAKLLLSAVALLGFATVYWRYLRPEPWLAEYLDVFWDGNYLEWYYPGRLDRLWGAIKSVLQPVSFSFDADLGFVVLLALSGYGLRCLIQRGPRMNVGLIVGPLLLVGLLAVIRRYPIAARLDLFLAPIVTLLVATAATGLARPRPKRAVAVVVGLILAISSVSSVRAGLDPVDRRPHARPMVATALAEYRAGEVVYVFARAAPEWLFYTTDWTRPDLARIAMIESEYRFPSGRTFVNGLTRNGPVTAHGTPLQAEHRGVTEVFGQYSGYFPATRGDRPTVDRGWAEVEVERMTAGAPQCLWLAILHGSPPERLAIRAALDQRGYRRWDEWAASTSRVDRGCLVENSGLPR